MKGKPIILAPAVEVERLRPFVDKVLESLGHPEALVTDMSCISDFDLDDDELQAVREMLDMDTLTGRERLVDMANVLQNRGS